MARWNSRWTGRVAVICALILASATRVQAQDAAAFIVMEFDSGKVLIERNADKTHAPASLVKMMLTYVVMDYIASGNASLSMPVTTSAHASLIGGSQVYLKQGETFTLEELMQAIEIASANDACVAVAEALVGSDMAMVVLMNEKAQEIGLTNTTYVNVHGLPPDRGMPDNVTTARDAATLARALIQKHPEVLRWTSTTRAPFRNGSFILNSTNAHLLERFSGADGLKTGYHSGAGFNLVATAKRDDVRLISVVLGTSSTRARTSETIKLLSTSFVTHQRRTVVKAGEVLPDRVYVEGSEHIYVPLKVDADMSLFAERNAFKEIRLIPQDIPNLTAPLKAGDAAGSFVAKLGEEVLGTVSLVVAEPVEKATLGWRVWNWRTPRPSTSRFMKVEEQPAAQQESGAAATEPTTTKAAATSEPTAKR
ncbi:MAG: D-alanyl-D-alanine carboxypeptidase [Candidatus Poribacteria bacterium]|nr:D-alanyl-D-alanine carboxypeptidase [Candidatus Poribacteria bacterium]